MAASEQDARINILNSLLKTPHRKLELVWPFHSDLVRSDPLFYQQLAAWYTDNGEIRDHKEAFAANLSLSEFPGHRDVGLALLREMPPYQLLRVVDWIHGTKKTKHIPANDGELAKAILRVRINEGLGDKQLNEEQLKSIKAQEAKTIVESTGLQRNIPKSMKTEVIRYLKEREEDPDWFDSSVLTARADMKRLYALLHIPPGERAQKILFEGTPPEGSKLHALKELAKAKTPADQAKAIIENKIPFRVAATVVHAMTPTVILALVETMSDAELINSMGMLRKRGALDNPEIKALVETKLEKAKKGKRVSALKASEAVKAAGLDANMQEKLEKVADSQVKARGRITRPTCLLVDCSGSMNQAIEVGKRIASLISAVAEAPLFVYAFNTMPYKIEGKGKDLSDWEKAFQGINATGGTSIGSGLMGLAREGHRVESIVIVSDGGENNAPSFADAYNHYATIIGSRPSVTLVLMSGDTNALEYNRQRAGIEMDTWEFAGSDYYSLPGLIPLLAKTSKLDLLLSIMEYPLPKRKEGPVVQGTPLIARTARRRK